MILSAKGAQGHVGYELSEMRPIWHFLCIWIVATVCALKNITDTIIKYLFKYFLFLNICILDIKYLFKYNIKKYHRYLPWSVSLNFRLIGAVSE